MASAAALPALAQNLVPNPSFEEYLECPKGTAGLDPNLVNWYSWQESPDFFHVCNNEGLGTAGVPQNAWGYQWPITGEGYAGIYTFVDFASDVREYMAAPLTEQLIIGQSYYLLFHVSLCDSSELITRKCATNNLGMRFFKDPTYSYFPPVNAFHADNFAHLNFEEVITDDQNWTLIEGWFTADDSYNWVAIGNFFDDQNTATIELNNEERCSAIYYIENVCVALDPLECDYLLSSPQTSQTQSQLRIFPNPAINDLNVTVEDGNIELLVIYDATGKELLRLSDLASNRMTIDVSAFQKGIYVLRVKTSNQIFNQKIIIK